MSYAKPNRRTLDIPAYNLRRSKLVASVVPEGLQPDLDILGIHASQGTILSRNSHILWNLSVTSLESIFCDSSCQRRPANPTFQGFSMASHLKSIFYSQLAESRAFTETAGKLNAKNPDERSIARQAAARAAHASRAVRGPEGSLVSHSLRLFLRACRAQLLRDRLRLGKQQQIIRAAGLGVGPAHVESAKRMRADHCAGAPAVEVEIADVELLARAIELGAG